MLQQYNPANENIKVWVDGELHVRKDAKISVFDSAVQGGDAVWEGLRVYPQGIMCFDRHLDRLYDSAHAMMFSGIPDRESVRQAIFETLSANGMRSDTHIRLTLTRGKKVTSGMDPRLNQSGCTLIVLAEWKPPVYDNMRGIRVITSAIRRNGPQYLDSKIHHNNLINNILAKVQANHAGVDAALMLDQNGFAAELNGTNIFCVRKGKITTPGADACLPGITRGLVIELCRQNEIPVEEANLSLTELYIADECFATGTMGEITPIIEIDGRKMRGKGKFHLTSRVRELFLGSIDRYCEPLPF